MPQLVLPTPMSRYILCAKATRCSASVVEPCVIMYSTLDGYKREIAYVCWLMSLHSTLVRKLSLQQPKLIMGFLRQVWAGPGLEPGGG